MTNTERNALYEQIIEHAEAELEANPLNETLSLIWVRIKTMLWGHFGLEDELLRPLAESKSPLHDLNDIVITKMTYEAN